MAKGDLDAIKKAFVGKRDKLVPYPEMTKPMIEAGEAYLKTKSFSGKYSLPPLFNWHDFYKAIVDAAPAAEAKEEPKEPKKAVTIPPLTPVTSSNIDAIGYDYNHNRLFVGFKGGGLYYYSDVPPDVYGDMKEASSIGAFFHKYVKSSYSFQKV